MKKILVLLLLTLILVDVDGQSRPVVDTGMLDSWPRLSPFEGDIALGRDGHYVAYILYGRPAGLRTLVVQDLRSSWKKNIVGRSLRILFFSADGRQLCWQQGDSVWLQAGGGQSRLLGVSNAVSYPSDIQGEWLALPAGEKNYAFRLVNLVSGKERGYALVKSHSWLARGSKLLLADSGSDVRLLNLVTGRERLWAGVKDFALPADAQCILLSKIKEDSTMSLQWFNLEGGEPATIWTGQAGEQPGSYVYDKAGQQLAFNVVSPSGAVAIWYYRAGEREAVLKADTKSTGFAAGLKVSGVRAFSDNGRWLFFSVRRPLPLLDVEAVTTAVDIWSYRDEKLYPAQTGNVAGFQDYTAVVEVSSRKVKLLEQEDNERIDITGPGDDFILSKGGSKDGNNRIDSWWPYNELPSLWQINLADDKKALIKKYDMRFIGVGASFSPKGHWIYYWDPELGHYIFRDPHTGTRVNLTAGLPVTVSDDIEQGIINIPVGLAGWYAEDSAVLVHDNYDIWKLDPSGRKAAVNMTGGYGRRQGIKLRLVYEDHNLFRGNEELLLTGFDVGSRYNGFFRIRLDKPGDPTLLTMGPYTYYQTMNTRQSFSFGMRPLVGGEGKHKRWVVLRESATEYPNFYVSNDLKRFISLTELQPQKAYNWLYTEAVNWRMYNGQLNYGVLYKPEDFDSTRKYPVIFNYYEKYSQRCHQFLLPGLTTDNINIPWFVSRGYLVFTPDIQFTVASKPGGMTIGEAAYNAVASAAEWLSQRPYVDKSRLGIQGHSFGGHETNAIITQTGLFAAAAELAGYSDHISAYLTLVGVPVENEHKIDHYNQRMGATPWERPDLFRRNSPVLNADKVVTPLLIAHNKKDRSVNFRQGIEMYMALRRLGKPCWLLQYDNSAHTLLDKKDALDYTIRLTQYFDHYLKGAPAPQWMTMHGLAGYKGKNNLYEGNPGEYCGKDCAVCREWNKEHARN